MQKSLQEKLRESANAAEIRGDWEDATLLEQSADRIIMLEAQNQAYRHALASGVSITLVAKKHWLKKD